MPRNYEVKLLPHRYHVMCEYHHALYFFTQTSLTRLINNCMNIHVDLSMKT